MMKIGMILGTITRTQRRKLGQAGRPVGYCDPKPLSDYERNLLEIKARRSDSGARPLFDLTTRPTTKKHNHTPTGKHFCPGLIVRGSDPKTVAIGNAQAREIHELGRRCGNRRHPDAELKEIPKSWVK